VPVNGRRGRPQGKCHRNQTAAAWRHPAVRAKRCGKSAPRPQQWGRQGKPHPEQGRIGADGAAPQGAGAGAFPPFRPGWPREAPSNVGSRGMAVHAPQGARQNPAYRPSDAAFQAQFHFARPTPPNHRALLRIYASNAFTKAFFGLSAQTFPWYPISSHKNPNALGGASGVQAGWSGEPAGSGGPVGR
jgi:hypothetical protein